MLRASWAALLLAALLAGGAAWMLAEPVGVTAAVGGALAGWAMVAGLILFAVSQVHRAGASVWPVVRLLLDGEMTAAAQEAAAHGEAAEPLLTLGRAVDDARAERDEARALANGLIHLGPHYTLVLSMRGRILDANPAFLARTGLEPESLNADPLLEQMLPLGPLVEMAQRSLAENTALVGIPYQLTLPGETRPLLASIRAVPDRSGGTAVVQLTDLSRTEELEVQVDRFTDALELMVDQRVAQLTAGRERLEALVESAGVVAFGFDREGGIVYVNRAAEGLTGRTQFTLRQIGQLVPLVCEPAREDAFHQWFWSAEAGTPFITQPEGRSLQWHVGVERRAGEVTRRLLLGMTIPHAQTAHEPVGLPGVLQRFEAQLAAQPTERLTPDARAYIRFIRDAVRHLALEAEGAEQASGDGAASQLRFAPSPERLDS